MEEVDNYNIIEKNTFSSCPFSYETLRKQWFNDTYHRTSYRLQVDAWENDSNVKNVNNGPLYCPGVFEKMVNGSVVPISIVHNGDDFVVIEPENTTSFLTRFGVGGKVNGTKAMSSLVHYVGLSKKCRRFNAVTLREEDVPMLLDMRDRLKKCLWTKRYYSQQLHNKVFVDSFLSWTGKDSIGEKDKDALVEFLMRDSAIGKDGIVRECVFKEKYKLFRDDMKEQCKEGVVGGFDLCKESAEYLAECLIYEKAPNVEVFYGLHVSPFHSQPFFHMHCFDTNLLTHSGKQYIQTLTPLSEIIEWLEKEKGLKNNNNDK